jgi:8-oxo-dGTP pyrophosphatase MutT (NUDIX family)
LALQKLLRHWTDRLALSAGQLGAARQAGAIPFTVLHGEVVFLVITSRRSGRWIFPKGAPIDGLEPWQVAAREALEEAGVEGDVDTHPIGSYRTLKTLAVRRAVIEVDMYPLRVMRQLDDWAEKKSRHRHWVILPEAKRLLAEPRLADLARLLSRRVLAKHQPAMERIIP